MKLRYSLTSNAGHYIESVTREEIEQHRKQHPELFRYKHVGHGLQAWSDTIRLDVLYPPLPNDRYSFFKHNKSLDRKHVDINNA